MAEKSLNKVTLLGRLGKDAETKFTPSGVAVTNFSIATTRRFKQGDDWKEETDWHSLVLWRAEKLAEYLKKGTRVHIEGSLRTRSYEKDGVKKYVTEINVTDVILLGDGNGSGGGSKKASEGHDEGPGPDDDDVPF